MVLRRSGPGRTPTRRRWGRGQDSARQTPAPAPSSPPKWCKQTTKCDGHRVRNTWNRLSTWRQADTLLERVDSNNNGYEGQYCMVERRQELSRRYHRKKKMRKLKSKLTSAQGSDREKILYKIHMLSPWWAEPAKE